MQWIKKHEGGICVPRFTNIWRINSGGNEPNVFFNRIMLSNIAGNVNDPEKWSLSEPSDSDYFYLPAGLVIRALA